MHRIWHRVAKQVNVQLWGDKTGLAQFLSMFDFSALVYSYTCMHFLVIKIQIRAAPGIFFKQQIFFLTLVLASSSFSDECISYHFQSDSNPSVWKQKNMRKTWRQQHPWHFDSTLIEVSAGTWDSKPWKSCLLCPRLHCFSSRTALTYNFIFVPLWRTKAGVWGWAMHQVSHSVPHSFDLLCQQWRLTLSCCSS